MQLRFINRAVLYCSKLSSIEISIEEQKRRLEKFCKHLGIEIVREYIDIDNENKPLFYQLIEDIKSKEFNVVLSFSSDTLSKKDDELKMLINELDKYNCELHLENTYAYGIVPRYLFRIPYEEEKPYVKKKKNTGFIPRFEEHEEINPKTKESINWVKMWDEDRVRFNDTPLFDNEGNYLGIKRDMIVLFKDFVGGYHRKKKQQEQLKYKPLW